MSQNIKLNPFNLVGQMNNDGLDFVIAAIPGSPTIQELAESISYFAVNNILYNASQVAPIDQIYAIGIVANTVNALSADSWCKDCCDNTFTSYEKMKARINEMGGFSSTQMTYINQILGMACNYNITVSECLKALEQLETAVLVDSTMSHYESDPVLLVLSISKFSLNYWITEAANASSLWLPYFTPLAPADYVRPFWLANMLGAIVSISIKISAPSMHGLDRSSFASLGMIGGISGSASYAIFK